MAKPSTIRMGKRTITAGGFVNDTYKFNGLKVYNESGSTIAVDKLVAIGVTYDVTKALPNVVLADANTATHQDIYVTLAAILNNAEGYVFKGGKSVADLDTSGATTVGDPLYLSETAGAFTSTAPTASDAIVLPVGWSTVKSSTVGQIHWHIGERQKTGINAIQSALVATTAAFTVSASAHAFRTVTFDAVAGYAATLPAATGTGNRYRFVVKTALTSNQYRFTVTGNDTFLGGHLTNDSGDTTAATMDFYPAAAANNQLDLTLLGGGGSVGDWVELEDVATDKWLVHAVFTSVVDPTNRFSTV